MAIDIENDPGWRYLRLSREQMMIEHSKPYDSKKDVWVPDAEEGFLHVQIVDKKGDMLTCSTPKGLDVKH